MNRTTSELICIVLLKPISLSIVYVEVMWSISGLLEEKTHLSTMGSLIKEIQLRPANDIESKLDEPCQHFSSLQVFSNMYYCLH